MDGMTRRTMLKHTAFATGGVPAAMILSGCSTNTAARELAPAGKAASRPDIPDLVCERLKAYPVRHGGRRRLLHPEVNRELHSQTAVCYLRFLGKAKVSHLELPVMHASVHAGRWTPFVPTHPAHVVVSVLDHSNNRWVPTRSVDLPANPRFAGVGLSQGMPIERMEDFFRVAVAEQPPHRIELGGIETDCLKVECDSEHPVWPSHGECNGGPYNVPFGILEGLRAFGEQPEAPTSPAYRRKLRKGSFAPVVPEGMTLGTHNPLEIVYRSNRIAVGFSLIRPMLTHLAWDYFGDGSLAESRLFFKGLDDRLGGLNGPSYITMTGNHVPQNMTGRVEVTGNQVRYLDIETGCGLTVDAVFTVTADAVRLELEQKAERDVPAIEAEAWRLVWDMRKGMTSVAGLPETREGRNGFVRMPAIIAGDDGGGLSVELLEGDGTFHSESYRSLEARSTGFVLSVLDSAESPPVIPKGTSRAVFELRPCILSPVSSAKETTLSEGMRRCWTAGFSAFRPEFGGFSNNAISVNCHVNQYVAFDFVAFTAKPAVGPDPLDLVKFSIGRALLDGGGYGYHRCLYLDSDPLLLSGAGRIVQLSGDHDWLARVGPGIVAAARRVLGNFDAEEGMIVCRSLSGNSGSHRWSSNGADVIGFGHIDAYVNAWSFRGLRNAASLFARLDEKELAARCAETASAIRENYGRQLVNPATGWVSGWRSRDGQLHDFGFIWVNAVACAFGAMEATAIRRALGNIEAKRREVFPESGYLGLPLNLLPIAETDHMLPRLGYDLKPTYEHYTDGALSPVLSAYYLRALSTNGFKDESGAIANSLEQAFTDGRFCGPYGTGKEMMTWSGADSGYEGTFGPSFGALYAIAVERGIITPPDPEWWL